MTQQIADAFGNPMTQMVTNMAADQAKRYLGNLQINTYTSRIFSPELRAYFDVQTDLVKNKLIKLLLPFRTFQFDDQIKKLQLYLPIVSLMTFIMFSTLLEGLESQAFHPSIMRRALWMIVFTGLQVMGAKMTQNAISHLNIGVVELIALVSYRFVSLSIVTIVLVITVTLFGPIRYIGVLYVLIVDTYFCKLELSNASRQRFKEDGVGNYIVLGVHIFVTALIMWLGGLL